jgi:hypothetical protein
MSVYSPPANPLEVILPALAVIDIVVEAVVTKTSVDSLCDE